jgi:hypothetical protein
VHEPLPIEEWVEIPVEALSRIGLDRNAKKAVPEPPHHAVDCQRLVRRDLVSERDAIRQKRQAAHEKATLVHLLTQSCSRASAMP